MLTVYHLFGLYNLLSVLCFPHTNTTGTNYSQFTLKKTNIAKGKYVTLVTQLLVAFPEDHFKDSV